MRAEEVRERPEHRPYHEDHIAGSMSWLAAAITLGAMPR